MKFKNTDVWGFEHALRGMRNPMNSWAKSDSEYVFDDKKNEQVFNIGENDMKLCKQLINAGNEHRKFLRQIFVSVDITAPLYFWSEFDTYKVGTVSNSTSKMHKLASTEITLDCFEMDDVNEKSSEVVLFWGLLIAKLEELRKKYNEAKEKQYWKELVRLLPESWLQKRTITLNYENILSIINQRKNHKLNEWSGRDNPKCDNFIAWTKTLPYASEFFYGGEL